MYDVTMYMRIYYINDLLYELLVVAYLRFHISVGPRGRVQNIFFGKVGVYVPCSEWRSQAFARGVWGMLPREIFLKWCNLVRFGVYFATIFVKKIVKILIFYIKIVKIVIFYIKIKDNALLSTNFRGVGAYSPDFLSLVRFGVFWSTFSVKFLFRKYYNYLNNIDICSVCEKLQATRAKVAPVNLIYGSHFSATGATYKVSQNMYCIVLYCIVLYCIVLYCIVLNCIVLYCIVLYYEALYWWPDWTAIV